MENINVKKEYEEYI